MVDYGDSNIFPSKKLELLYHVKTKGEKNILLNCVTLGLPPLYIERR